MNLHNNEAGRKVSYHKEKHLMLLILWFSNKFLIWLIKVLSHGDNWINMALYKGVWDLQNCQGEISERFAMVTSLKSRVTEWRFEQCFVQDTTGLLSGPHMCIHSHWVLIPKRKKGRQEGKCSTTTLCPIKTHINSTQSLALPLRECLISLTGFIFPCCIRSAHFFCLGNENKWDCWRLPLTQRCPLASAHARDKFLHALLAYCERAYQALCRLA